MENSGNKGKQCENEGIRKQKAQQQGHIKTRKQRKHNRQSQGTTTGRQREHQNEQILAVENKEKTIEKQSSATQASRRLYKHPAN